MLQFALGLALLSVVSGQDDPLASLAQNIPGVPGEDYPIFAFPPDTSFVCDGKIEGYYSDQDADCQAFHICGNDGSGSLIKYSFLCPNGTLFNQQYFICDWWFNVDCSQAEDFYSLNEDVAAAAAAATAAGAGDGEATNDLATYSLPADGADAASPAQLVTGVLPPPAQVPSRVGRKGGRR